MDKEDINTIISLVQWRKELECTERIIEEHYWKPLIEILSKNEKNTINFLENCSDDILYWISEIFEYISKKFQSIEFVKFLRKLQKEHPSIDLEIDIKSAEYAIMN